MAANHRQATAERLGVGLAKGPPLTPYYVAMQQNRVSALLREWISNLPDDRLETIVADQRARFGTIWWLARNELGRRRVNRILIEGIARNRKRSFAGRVRYAGNAVTKSCSPDTDE